MPPATPRPVALADRAFWWATIAIAPPLALAVAAAGYGIVSREPVADLGTIALWSVAEEIVFRGGVLPALRRVRLLRSGRFGISAANVLSSVLFAAFHAWRHPLAVAAGVFPVSLALGHAREASGRVWPAAALHVYFNALLYAATPLVAAWR